MQTIGYTPVLTIAGSDSSGGAGIQADLKTIMALGGYGMTAITAITAQNTHGVSAVDAVSPAMVAAQIDAVFNDISVVAVKTGMLFSAEIIEVVAQKMRQYQPRFLIVDPVMIAQSGHALLQADAVEMLKLQLLPLATMITPNIPEAQALTGLMDETDQVKLANSLQTFCSGAILVKGGHCDDAVSSRDYLLLPGAEGYWYSMPRINTTNTHGTGCTLASAIATLLAQGEGLRNAVQAAKMYLQGALIHGAAKPLGQGHGPVEHNWQNLKNSNA